MSDPVLPAGSVDAPPDPAEEPTSTRERVLVVARELFLERGYDRTTVSAIADQVGISAPALYWHFASKEDILYSIIEDNLKRFLDAIAAPEDAEPVAELRSLVRRYVLLQLDWRAEVVRYSSIVHTAQSGHTLTPEHQRQFAQLQRQVLETFRSLLRKGVQTGQFRIADVTVTAFALISLCEQVVTWVRPDGRLKAEEIAALYVEIADRVVGLD